MLMLFQWIGLMEYIPCYGVPAVQWGLLPVTRLANRKYLLSKILKGRQGQHSMCLASWVQTVGEQRIYTKNATNCPILEQFRNSRKLSVGFL